MYKNLFKNALDILVSPSKTWDRLSGDNGGEKKHLTGYFYPLIAMVAFAAFLSPIIKGYEELEFKAIVIIGLQFFIVSLASSYFGFLITAKLLNFSFVRWFGMKSDSRKAERLTVYASTPVLIVSILTRLLSDFFFMKFLFIYVIVLVWEANSHFYQVEESKRSKFTALASIAILAMPIIVEKVFLVLLPGLK